MGAYVEQNCRKSKQNNSSLFEFHVGFDPETPRKSKSRQVDLAVENEISDQLTMNQKYKL